MDVAGLGFVEQVEAAPAGVLASGSPASYYRDNIEEEFASRRVR